MEKVDLGNGRIYEYDSTHEAITYKSSSNDRKELTVSFSTFIDGDAYSCGEYFRVQVTKTEKPLLKFLNAKRTHLYSRVFPSAEYKNKNVKDIISKHINIGENANKDMERLINKARETIISEGYLARKKHESEKSSIEKVANEQQKQEQQKMYSKVVQEMHKYIR